MARRGGTGAAGSETIVLSRLFLRERFVARKLSWFDNPRPVPRRRKPGGLRKRVEPGERWRERPRGGKESRNSRIEPLPAKFFHGGSCAIICSTHRQQIQYAASQRTHGFRFSFRSAAPLPVSPRYAPPPYSPSSLSTGGTTSVRGVRVRTARHTLGFAVVCDPPVPVVVSAAGVGGGGLHRAI